MKKLLLIAFIGGLTQTPNTIFAMEKNTMDKEVGEMVACSTCEMDFDTATEGKCCISNTHWYCNACINYKAKEVECPPCAQQLNIEILYQSNRNQLATLFSCEEKDIIIFIDENEDIPVIQPPNHNLRGLKRRWNHKLNDSGISNMPCVYEFDDYCTTHWAYCGNSHRLQINGYCTIHKAHCSGPLDR